MLGFSDCMVLEISRKAGHLPLGTFDRNLSRLDSTQNSLYWIKEEQVIIGYDNHYPKGHHRHYGKKQESYEFTTIENLMRDFLEDYRRIRHES